MTEDESEEDDSQNHYGNTNIGTVRMDKQDDKWECFVSIKTGKVPNKNWRTTCEFPNRHRILSKHFACKICERLQRNRDYVKNLAA